MANTITYAQALDIAIATIADVADEAVIEKLTALKAQMEKRGSTKTPTKTQKENEVIMGKILESMESIGEPTTVTDLINFGVEGFELSNQKVSALLRKLVEMGKVVKTTEGKKSMFALA